MGRATLTLPAPRLDPLRLPDQHDPRFARLHHPRSTLHTLSRMPGEQERRSNFRRRWLVIDGVCKVEQPSRSLRTLNSDKKSRCLVFCPFEACLGICFPVQGVLRGALISNEHRAIVPSLLHIPLNIFVVVVLMKGVSSARYAIPTPHLLEPYDWPCRRSTVVVSRTQGIRVRSERWGTIND